MRLQKVQIENYKSVQKCDIEISPACRVLVGINEAGKSNILKALALLSPLYSPTPDDKRQNLSDEPEITSAVVRFIFEFSDDEIAELTKSALEMVYAGSRTKSILKLNETTLTPEQFFQTRTTGNYRVDIIKPQKFATAFSLGDEFQIMSDWKKPSSACPADYKHADIPKPLRQYKAIHLDDFAAIPPAYITDLEVPDVHEIILEKIKAHILANLPEVIFWTYEDKNLLPSQIPLAQFQANPNICVPLKNMFELAEITDIAGTLGTARQQPQKLRNLLNRVAERATKHLQSVWREMKGVEIHLAPNGEFIDASIRDKQNHFSFSNRSDGFKRFITFLLIISSRVKTKALANALILIDEPEIGLHPSGARFLMEELIRISSSNLVVYSTHSIFMIDRDRVDRHYIVSKTKEITTASVADESNISDEEVIYKALGYTMFDSLKKTNILFEGWRDKRLFQIAMKKPLKGFEKLRTSFDGIGTCHAEGVKDIRKVSQMLELASRDCIILSDTDVPATQARLDHQSKHGYGQWVTYGNLLPSEVAVTGEDFIKPSAFEKIIHQVAKECSLPPMTEADLLSPHGKIHAIRKWLGKLGNDQCAALTSRIKSHVFDNLDSQHIEPKYFDMLSEFAKRVQSSGKKDNSEPSLA